LGHGKGPAAARNAGLKLAKAPLVLFLDADDLLHPQALARMLQYYSQAGGRYIYTDWQRLENGVLSIHGVPEYSPFHQLSAPQHGVTVLMSRDKALQIGFNADLAALEDWDFFIRCGINGYHGYHVAEPLLITRRVETSRTVQASKKHGKLLKDIRQTYLKYAEGENQMAGCCGGNGNDVLAAKAALGFFDAPAVEGLMQPELGPTMVRVEFIGEQRGSMSFGGPGITPSGKVYRGGNNPFDKYADAHPDDVVWLENSMRWKRVNLTAPVPVTSLPLETEITTPVTPVPVVVEEPKKEKTVSGRKSRKARPAADSGDAGNV